MATTYPDYSVMVICAGDVDAIWHDVTDNGKNEGAQGKLPAAGAVSKERIGYIHDGNFTLLAELRCNDQILEDGKDPVYYGLVLKATKPIGAAIAVGDMLVAVRGTMDRVEWMNNVDALKMINVADGVHGRVGEGFWSVYATLGLRDPAGADLPGSTADSIVALAQANQCGRILVCGHSLGAALATYLSYDLTLALADKQHQLRPYFFASPMTGTGDWVDFYQSEVLNYDLANYALDFVPMVPPNGDILNAGGGGHNVHIIPALSQGCLDDSILARLDAQKNHSPIGYARMLDPGNPVAWDLQYGV